MQQAHNKKVSLKFIAELAGCSTTTVSNVLNNKGLFGEEIRDKILEIVKKYSYKMNPSARALRLGKSETVALVFYRPNVDIFKSEYYLTMTCGFQKRLSELGYEILLSEIPQDVAEAGAQPRFVSRGKADAIVALGRIPDGAAESLKNCGLPMLMLDSFYAGIDSIYTDGFSATQKLVERLAAQGHKKIAYLAYDNSDFNTDMRIKGYLAAVENAGLAPRVVRNFATNEEGGDELQKLLELPDRPTAVLASNDDLATSLMCRALSMGFEVPDAVAFCGFDDTVLATRCTPPLTTVHVDCEEIGAVGAETVLRRIASPSAEPKTEIVKVDIVERASTLGA